MERTIFSTVLITAYILDLIEAHCADTTIMDWVGNSFTIKSTERCVEDCGLIGCCYDTCDINGDIFELAIANTNWDWNNDDCNDKFLTNTPGSNDMKCSSQGLNIVFSSLDFYDVLFDSACKIHDMCYKINGGVNKDSDCDKQFLFNMDGLCYLKYPHWETILNQSECYAAARHIMPALLRLECIKVA